MEGDSRKGHVAFCSRPTSQQKAKVDPSFKSKRYRDKHREQIKAMEALLPVDRATLQRKLDSQTVFRLVIAYFRTKIFFQAAGFSRHDTTVSPIDRDKDGPSSRDPEDTKESAQDGAVNGTEGTSYPKSDVYVGEEHTIQALDGFLLVVTSDGTILYVSSNISATIGFSQVDLLHRCIYGIVHPDDHHDLKSVLEQRFDTCSTADKKHEGVLDHGPTPSEQMSVKEETLSSSDLQREVQDHSTTDNAAVADDSKEVSFLCRLKCFNGTSTGYVKVHCTGKMRAFPERVKPTSRTSAQVAFVVCRPYVLLTTDPCGDTRQNAFWSKHDVDFKIKALHDRVTEILEYEPGELEGTSFYSLVHPDDLATCYECHKSLLENSDVQSMYFRALKKDHAAVWLHSRGKVVLKNSRKSIVFSHCPVREEDSLFLHQEGLLRRRYGTEDLLRAMHAGTALQYPYEAVPADDIDYSPCGHSGGKSLRRRRCNPGDVYGGLKDEFSVSLHSPHGACPSSMHSGSDRDSSSPASNPSSRKRPRKDSRRCDDVSSMNSNQHLANGYPHAFPFYYPMTDGYIHRVGNYEQTLDKNSNSYTRVGNGWEHGNRLVGNPYCDFGSSEFHNPLPSPPPSPRPVWNGAHQGGPAMPHSAQNYYSSHTASYHTYGNGIRHPPASSVYPGQPFGPCQAYQSVQDDRWRRNGCWAHQTAMSSTPPNPLYKHTDMPSSATVHYLSKNNQGSYSNTVPPNNQVALMDHERTGVAAWYDCISQVSPQMEETPNMQELETNTGGHASSCMFEGTSYAPKEHVATVSYPKWTTEATCRQGDLSCDGNMAVTTKHAQYDSQHFGLREMDIRVPTAGGFLGYLYS
ncbi:AHR [Branchiostoma lanceolatum]|uniref:AHR protein n=1 Tax=Branchiostoma lanceolatum TaxID=7740 RepID=A0A8J9ZQ22_BRALA|nr:AHR [Branchiostoma lanceolatum]